MQSTRNLPEIHAGRTLISVGLADAADAALGEEDANERRIIAARPLLHRERERIRVVLGRIGELEEAVHRDARVVEAKPKKGQLKVEVLVQLRHRRMDVRLQVAVVAVAALIEEPVQEVRAQLSESLAAD